MAQHEITKPMPVPGKDGRITEPGYARTEILVYTRENMKAPWFRKKEWDYYLFTTDKFAVAFTISDLGYVGLLSASFIDFEKGTEHTESEIGILPRGKKYGLGTRVKDAHAECHTKRLDLVFDNEGDHRKISCAFKNFDGGKDLYAEMKVYEPEMEAMYIATPWKEKETAFYYNCKRNCLEAEGTVTYGDRTEVLYRESCLGCLDWGRGIWTYDNTWYWGTGSGRIDGAPFGFNLGYGFSDRSEASENCLYYGSRIHKLSEVEFVIPKTADGRNDYLKPWSIRSDDGAFTGTFVPIIDRSACMNFGIIVSDQHQVFGRMTGSARLENGEEIGFTDFICALEVVRNKY